jgi:hypothetical protein
VDEQEHPAGPKPPATPGQGVRAALVSRGAGWAVATALAGAVVGLSVTMATSSSPTVVVEPEGAAGVRALVPAGLAGRVPPRPQVSVGVSVPAVLAPGIPPGHVRVRIPARLRIQAPVYVRGQVPVGLAGPMRVIGPVRLRGPVRVLIPGGQRPAAALMPGRPAPARLRIQVRNGVPVPVSLVNPAGPRGQARLTIRIPARVRISPALPAPPNW